jgi:hypothetical protein
MANQKEIATHLDLTTRSIYDLTQKGILQRDGKKSYDLDQCRIAYIRHLRAMASGHKSEDGDLDLIAERARLTKIQGDLAALQLKEREGDLIGADIAMEEWGNVVQNVRAKLLAIPTKLAPLAMACKTLPAMRDRIEASIHEVMREIAANPNLREKSKKKSRTVGKATEDATERTEREKNEKNTFAV